MEKIRVLVWNENIHERRSAAIRKIYPDGIHGAIAEVSLLLERKHTARLKLLKSFLKSTTAPTL